MKAIKCRYSGSHKTVLDIGDNDVIIRIAINQAIEKCKEVFRGLCKSYYKDDNKNFINEAALKDIKITIRKYYDIRDALDNPEETTSAADARSIASTLF